VNAGELAALSEIVKVAVVKEELGADVVGARVDLRLQKVHLFEAIGRRRVPFGVRRDTHTKPTRMRVLAERVEALDKSHQIHRMLEAVWRVVGEANRYVDAQAPWTLRKTNPPRMATVLFVLADVIRILAIYAQAVVPGSAGKMLDQLAVPADKRSFADIATPLVAGTALPKPEGIFPRYVEAEEAKA